MMGRGDKWWGAAVTVAVCCALFGMCDGDYEPKSILCDDVDAICAKNDFDHPSALHYYIPKTFCTADDKEIHFESYSNPCHSAQEAWNNQGIDADIIVAAYGHLQYLSEVPQPVCSRDGYYAAVQYLAGKAYCADRNGNRIENYELPIHEAENMNCREFT
ncbi:hypothetical protein E2C01_024486 [Portunus trituberculatus]|uniref:Thyroglobulin type-1 domain-containing protein n=1 Tax=Portunus trituberculatus TaxID=210409 RepID=A0A5B7EDX5_PORTR|nr:hypothetical protein [Portunus trituberculatus]